MQFLGHSLEIWGVVALATFAKLRASNRLGFKSAVGIAIIAIGSSILFYKPIIILLGLSPSWELIIAGLIALTFEDVMQSVISISKDNNLFREIIKFLITKK